jgi:hypothetical protein
MKDAADEIERLRAAKERLEGIVDLLENNARQQGKLLADAGREIERLRAQEQDYRNLTRSLLDMGGGDDVGTPFLTDSRIFAESESRFPMGLVSASAWREGAKWARTQLGTGAQPQTCIRGTPK